MAAANELIADPRVFADVYQIYPSCHPEIGLEAAHDWSVAVVNGYKWGWSMRRGHPDSSFALNSEGEFVCEGRRSEDNANRRWPLEEALALALKFVDERVVAGHTAQQWADKLAARKFTPGS